ncbi:hypothetical protein BPMI_00184c [Candidatus Burkholderia pumila]|uniref:Uncharacterized protein n=1 Tax=Candidatus Burkholderia pumila TaxID=1090375 RepID=A0ABR5HLJ3_9BURK|nr:hypothetical protein BPMI_00184c [Candidatus Burkholderia pumila]
MRLYAGDIEECFRFLNARRAEDGLSAEYWHYMGEDDHLLEVSAGNLDEHSTYVVGHHQNSRGRAGNRARRACRTHARGRLHARIRRQCHVDRSVHPLHFALSHARGHAAHALHRTTRCVVRRLHARRHDRRAPGRHRIGIFWSSCESPGNFARKSFCLPDLDALFNASDDIHWIVDATRLRIEALASGSAPPTPAASRRLIPRPGSRSPSRSSTSWTRSSARWQPEPYYGRARQAVLSAVQRGGRLALRTRAGLHAVVSGHAPRSRAAVRRLDGTGGMTRALLASGS